MDLEGGVVMLFLLLAAAPLPAAHSYGLQPQGAGNSSTTAMTQSVSPTPPSPIPPNLCDQRTASKTNKNLMFFNRLAPVLLKVVHRVSDCTSGPEISFGRCHLQPQLVLVGLIWSHKYRIVFLLIAASGLCVTQLRLQLL